MQKWHCVQNWHCLNAKLALCAKLALSMLQKWHCLQNWHCVDCINGIVCKIGIVYVAKMALSAYLALPKCKIGIVYVWHPCIIAILPGIAFVVAQIAYKVLLIQCNVLCNLIRTCKLLNRDPLKTHSLK